MANQQSCCCQDAFIRAMPTGSRAVTMTIKARNRTRHPHRILTGYHNRIGAIFSWWFAFTRDLRRERTFTIDDLPTAAGAYGDIAEPDHPADNTV